MQNYKAQVSAEFFILFMVIIAIFSGFFLLNTQIQTLVNQLLSYNEAVSAAFEVGVAVNNVIGNRGLVIVASLPPHYSISYQPGAIIATDVRSNVSGSWPIPYVPIILNAEENSTEISVSLAGNSVQLIGSK